jgi:hypothetical protein
MRMMRCSKIMKMLLPMLAFIVLFVPFAAWTLYKPTRVLAPSWVGGISCVDADICMDDTSRYTEALQLYKRALDSVSETVGPFQHKPRITFCSTQSCFRAFGFNKASAMTIAKYGIVISPRGWKPYYVRHEMIHHRQAEELGVLAPFRKPEWLMEGMAYSLSDDPRNPLSDRWQEDRDTFETWYKTVGRTNLWIEAGAL